MNVAQAIEFAKLRVSGKIETTPENDAVLICWLLHCYADLHQPLHSTAMFSRDLLAKGQGRKSHSDEAGAKPALFMGQFTRQG